MRVGDVIVYKNGVEFYRFAIINGFDKGKIWGQFEYTLNLTDKKSTWIFKKQPKTFIPQEFV